jgi:hypothetical protein
MAPLVWKKCGHPRTHGNTWGMSALKPGGQCRICKQAAMARYRAATKTKRRTM